MSDNVIPFPVSTSCSGRTMPGLTTPELRRRARDNFYTAERLSGCDPLTAYDRAEAFAADIERIADIMPVMTEQNTSRYAPTKATIICLVALSIGPLTLEGRLWRFEQRFFSPRTVNHLIALGMAVRDGNEVRYA